MTAIAAATCAGPGCSRPLPAPVRPGGRKRVFCSGACRVAAYRARTGSSRRGPGPALAVVSGGAAASWPIVWEPDTPVAAPLEPVTGAAGKAVNDDCGEPLYWEPSGTLQVCIDPGCPDHDKPVFPLSLTSQDRAVEDPRREATPDEQLGQKLARAALRRRLIAWVDDRLKDDQLHPDTRGHLEEVFRPEIQKAQSLKQLGWLAERLFTLPVRTLTPPRPVIQAKVISDSEAANGQRPAAVTGRPGLRELGQQALSSLTGSDGVATVPRFVLPAGDQASASAGYLTSLGFCDHCAELRQQGRHTGRFGAAVVKVEFRGHDGLQFIDGKPQPALCQDCWDWLRTTQPAGSYFVTDQAESVVPRTVIAGRPA